MGETSWAFLLIGSFAAVGAALTLGTVAALVRYRRTGTMPGSDTVEELPRRRLVALWVRIGVGIVVTAIGVVALQRGGLI